MKGIISLSVLATLATASEDLFNYESTSGSDFGPEEWDKVSCDNLETCVSSRAADLIRCCLSYTKPYWHLLFSKNSLGGPTRTLALWDGVWSRMYADGAQLLEMTVAYTGSHPLISNVIVPSQAT